MDIGYEKERFESFKIKASVAKKFRKYSREISKSHSMTLLLMLEFFENNGVSPTENFGPKMVTLENLIKKRINGVIAILKDIEKTQTKPSAGMISALFEQGESNKKTLMIEKKRLGCNNTILNYRNRNTNSNDL
ncbi:BfmA/BtgA family mobilization protein [Antarcticibacterium arcticum]|uniref:BfmA/BtgA family mobilization protein n=1 Tax=Antarcticibacterium arcticum TaxID=2585771 RepID=UPI00196B7E65|nr:BfmA/BtgA family mobilization protein [Antarcticibacterium arcticum]